jgi:hypothetical protein
MEQVFQALRQVRAAANSTLERKLTVGMSEMSRGESPGDGRVHVPVPHRLRSQVAT